MKATPEELDAVQILSRRLVEDYGYNKTQIQTRPQFRVRKRPSDEEKSYPVDIAVFKTDSRTEYNLLLIAECKKKNRKDGLEQLKLYMDMSPAEVGIWFNGQDHAYLHKVLHRDGLRTYEDLPNIPRRGQRIEDIGRFYRRDLKPPSDLKSVFRDLRNHLAGNLTGITRDEALAQQIINILFCKIYDEINKGPDEIVTFRSGTGEPPKEVKKRIIELFEEVKKQYNDVFEESDVITLDAENLAYVVGELQIYCITEAARDAVGDAFEVFIGPALRGNEGQFFTPRNVVKMIIDILDPNPEEMIIDPACGSGGFLIVALEHVWQQLEKEAEEKKWTAVLLDRKKREVASKFFRGIDKDSFLAKVTKAYMAIIGDGRGGVFCENSLLPPIEWKPHAQDSIKLGTFNVLFTNPPFGTKIPVKGYNILSQYDLGYKWKRNKQNGIMEKTTELYDDQPPQILFLERCLQLLGPGGRMGIVLPEAIFGMPTYEYVVTFLKQKAKIFGIVSMPEALFKTSGKGGTHTKTCVLFLENTQTKEDYYIFMSDVKWCGHDSRGNRTVRIDAAGNTSLLDDVPIVAIKYKELMGNIK
ncbi:MAG: restriction endonuclease subunit M [Methanotrichaceae archaeon]